MKKVPHASHGHAILYINVFVATLLLASCQGIKPWTIRPTGSPTQNPPTETLSPTATAKLPPTSEPTFTPTLTPTVTLTPTPTSTPLPWAKTPITSENTNQLTLLAQWGQGSVLWKESVEKDRVIVKSTTGVYLFQDSTTQLLAEYLGAVQYSVSPDNEKVAILFPDMSITLILLQDASEIHTYLPQGPIPGYLCEGCDDFTLQSMTSEAARTTSLAFSRDGRFLACGYPDRSIGVWDTETGALKARLYNDVAGNAWKIIFAPDGKHIASIGSSLFENTPWRLTYWSVEEQKLLWYLNTSGNLDPGLFSPDSNIFGYYRKVINLLDTRDGSTIAQINGMAGQNPYTPDSSLFVTTSRAGNIQIEQVQPKYVHLWTIYTNLKSATAEVSADGTEIIVNGGEKVYSVPGFKLISEGPPPDPEVPEDPDREAGRRLTLGFGDQPRGIIVLPDNQLYLWGGMDPIWRWDPLTNRMDWIDLTGESLADPAISPDGSKVANCYSDRLEIQSFSGESTTVSVNCLSQSVMAFVPGNDVLAVGRSNKIATYDLTTGEHIQDFLADGYPIKWMEFSAQGNFVAAGGRICGPGGCTGDQHVWQLLPPEGISLVPEGSQNAVDDIVFTSDETKMISAKGYLWQWDLASGNQEGKYSLFGTKLAISPDDRLLAVGDWDGTITILSTDNRQIVTDFHAHKDGIIDLAFTPDGANLLTLGSNGSLKVWGVR